MPTDDDERQRRENAEKSLQAMRKGLADRAQQAAKDREDLANLDEEIRKIQEGNGT